MILFSSFVVFNLIRRSFIAIISILLITFWLYSLLLFFHNFTSFHAFIASFSFNLRHFLFTFYSHFVLFLLNIEIVVPFFSLAFDSGHLQNVTMGLFLTDYVAFLFLFLQVNEALLSLTYHRDDWWWHQARRDPVGWADSATQDSRPTNAYVTWRVETSGCHSRLEPEVSLGTSTSACLNSYSTLRTDMTMEIDMIMFINMTMDETIIFTGLSIGPDTRTYAVMMTDSHLTERMITPNRMMTNCPMDIRHDRLIPYQWMVSTQL